MRAPGRVALAASLVVVIAFAAVRPAEAWDLGLEAGGTGLVSGVTYDDGGAAILGLVTWPVDVPKGWPSLRFGLQAFMNDIGETSYTPVDPTTGQPLGQIVSGHRDIFGAGWRFESTLATRDAWETGVDAGWNYYRIEDDVAGDVYDGLSSIGFSLGASVGRSIGSSQSLSLAFRYHRLFNDATGRYATAAVEWRRRGAREGSR